MHGSQGVCVLGTLFQFIENSTLTADYWHNIAAKRLSCVSGDASWNLTSAMSSLVGHRQDAFSLSFANNYNGWIVLAGNQDM